MSNIALSREKYSALVRPMVQDTIEATSITVNTSEITDGGTLLVSENRLSNFAAIRKAPQSTVTSANFKTAATIEKRT